LCKYEVKLEIPIKKSKKSIGGSTKKFCVLTSHWNPKKVGICVWVGFSKNPKSKPKSGPKNPTLRPKPRTKISNFLGLNK
jgi:hypothetical protein